MVKMHMDKLRLFGYSVRIWVHGLLHANHGFDVDTFVISGFLFVFNVALSIIILSFEKQKGTIIAAQRCSLENKKGAIDVQSQQW